VRAKKSPVKSPACSCVSIKLSPSSPRPTRRTRFEKLEFLQAIIGSRNEVEERRSEAPLQQGFVFIV